MTIDPVEQRVIRPRLLSARLILIEPLLKVHVPEKLVPLVLGAPRNPSKLKLVLLLKGLVGSNVVPAKLLLLALTTLLVPAMVQVLGLVQSQLLVSLMP